MRIPTNKVGDILNYFRSELTLKYEQEEIDILASYCFQDFNGFTKKDLLLDPDKRVSESDLLKYSFAVKDLKRGRPIQYILGHAWFMGHEFEVNESVLIPRPETEELAQLVIDELMMHDETVSVLDIGTGSGCIPISVKIKKPRTHVYAIDISQDALAVAIQNAEKLNAEVKFIHADFLDRTKWEKLPPVSVIVSNPPYVKESESASMADRVKDHEPHAALFVPDEDALIFYKAIAEFAMLKLKDGGKVMVEINEALGIETCIVFQKAGLSDVQLKQDMQEKDRFIVAQKLTT
jgi:release factor glutamine methyltransferase